MEITDVRIFPVVEDKLKGYASVVFDDCFLVNDIKVIHGRDGLFISMPARRRKDGSYKDVAHPLDSKTRIWIQDRILAAYAERMESTIPAEERTEESFWLRRSNESP